MKRLSVSFTILVAFVLLISGCNKTSTTPDVVSNWTLTSISHSYYNRTGNAVTGGTWQHSTATYNSAISRTIVVNDTTGFLTTTGGTLTSESVQDYNLQLNIAENNNAITITEFSPTIASTPHPLTGNSNYVSNATGIYSGTWSDANGNLSLGQFDKTFFYYEFVNTTSWAKTVSGNQMVLTYNYATTTSPIVQISTKLTFTR